MKEFLVAMITIFLIVTVMVSPDRGSTTQVVFPGVELFDQGEEPSDVFPMPTEFEELLITHRRTAKGYVAWIVDVDTCHACLDSATSWAAEVRRHHGADVVRVLGLSGSDHHRLARLRDRLVFDGEVILLPGDHRHYWQSTTVAQALFLVAFGAGEHLGEVPLPSACGTPGAVS